MCSYGSSLVLGSMAHVVNSGDSNTGHSNSGLLLVQYSNGPIIIAAMLY